MIEQIDYNNHKCVSSYDKTSHRPEYRITVLYAFTVYKYSISSDTKNSFEWQAHRIPIYVAEHIQGSRPDPPTNGPLYSQKAGAGPSQPVSLRGYETSSLIPKKNKRVKENATRTFKRD